MKRVISVSLCVIIVCSMFFWSGTPLTAQAASKVAKPKISVNGGSFTGSKSVTLTCSTKYAIIYYKLGGKPDIEKDKYVISGKSVSINKTGQLYAIAVVDGVKSATLKSKEFKIKTKTPTKTQVPANKNASAGYTIKLTAPSSTTLYYTLTTNGSNPKAPTKESKKVTAKSTKSIKINKTTKLKVMAIKTGCSKSSVVSRTYKVKVPKAAIGAPGESVDEYYTQLGSFYFETDFLDRVAVTWIAQNLSGKEIKYYTLNFSMYNSVGDPAICTISNSNKDSVKYVGPVPTDSIVLAFDHTLGYTATCSMVVLDTIDLEYMDGTKETVEYGYYTTDRR